MLIVVIFGLLLLIALTIESNEMLYVLFGVPLLALLTYIYFKKVRGGRK